MTKAFTIYEKDTGKILSNRICAPGDLRTNEGEEALDGIFSPIEYTVSNGAAVKKPQAEIDAHYQEEAAHLEKARAANIDPIALLSEVLRSKGIDIKSADLTAAKTKLKNKTS